MTSENTSGASTASEASASDATDPGIPSPEGAHNLIETDYEVGQHNVTPQFGKVQLDIHNPVFGTSAAVVVTFVVLCVLFHSALEGEFTALRNYLTSQFDWFFLLAGDIFVVLSLALIVSPLGKIRLGGSEARPDFSYASWFAMLFAAGMGIGLMYYGVSEPIGHYQAALGGAVVENGVRTDWSPLGGAAGDVAAAHSLGMAGAIYHWGLHPWAIYAVLALALALFAYNKGLPMTIRSVFYPVLGEKTWGWPGHVIDVLAVFATLSGMATSLGLGAYQVNSGLNMLFGIPESGPVLIAIITVITLIALVSVVAGLEAGVKRLSQINLVMAISLLLFVFFIAATSSLISAIFSNTVAYLEHLPALMMPFGREDVNFTQGWTAFYWAWWMSWSPFVAMFIARVSRGRTVREFLICALLIPTFVSIMWMTIFGDTGIATGQSDLFAMLGEFPLATLSSIVGVSLVVIFFVTSSDSGSLVIDAITAGGKVNAPTVQRVFWAILSGSVAAVLLLGGGLNALQAASVSTGLPFAVVLLVACYALVKGLMSEPRN